MRGHTSIEHLVKRLKRLCGASAHADDGIVDIIDIAEECDPRAIIQPPELRIVPGMRFGEFVNLLLLKLKCFRVLVVEIREMIFQTTLPFDAPARVIVQNFVEPVTRVDQGSLDNRDGAFVHLIIERLMPIQQWEHGYNCAEHGADLRLRHLVTTLDWNDFVHRMKSCAARFQSQIASTALSSIRMLV